MYPANSCISGGSLESKLTLVQDSGAKFMRVGGTSYDKYLTQESDFVNIANTGLVDKLLAQGFTPIVQLSYYQPQPVTPYPCPAPSIYLDPGARPGDPPSITGAATHLVNDIVIPLYAKGVTYFSIGNEPNNNVDYGTTNIYTHAQNSAEGIYDYISAISSAIRALNHPDIKLLGPELSFFDESLIDPLTTTYNILPHIDYFTFHYYPFGDEGNDADSNFPDATDRNIVNLPRVGAPVVYNRNGDLVNSLEYKLDRLISRMSGYPNVEIGITETNLCYENYNDDYDTDGIDYTNSAGNLIHVYGTNSYIAGQFWAEMMAVCMSKGVAIINFWSVIEGGQVPYNTNVGYINSANDNLNSTYYHFQMLAKHFSGKFKWGTITAAAGVIPKPRIKAFASDNSTKINIMIMNQDQDPNNQIDVRVKLNNSVAVPPGGVCINISDAIGISNATWNTSMPGQSTLLLRYDRTSGIFTQELKYTSVDNFNNLAPH